MFELQGDIKGFGSFLNTWNNAHDFIEAKTSGSTGEPKTIKLAKADMIKSALATNKFFGIDSSSVLYCPLSVNYIAGKMMLVRAWSADCKLMVETPSNNLAFNDYNDGEEISLLCIVPSQIPSVIEGIRKGVRIKHIIIGGARPDDAYEHALLKMHRNSFVTFGMTETCSHVALRKLGSDIFDSLPGITFGIDGNSRLIINIKDREIDTLVTNDIVDLLSPHSFRWKGRFDNVINTGGVKVYPEEIENKLKEILKGRFAITSTSDEKWGSMVVLVIESFNENLNEASLMSNMRQILLPGEIPKRIFQVEELPTTSNGKIARSELKLMLEKMM